MTSKKTPAQPPAPEAEQPEAPIPAPDSTPAPEVSAEADAPQELQKQLAEARALAEEYKDGWQRAVAELQNYRKRQEREQADTYQLAVGSIVKHYLPVQDDLERALTARPADLPWAEGIELILRKLQAILESEGLKRIQAEGQPFDPNFHEAISQEASAEVESGHVIAVVRNGYMLGDRVIRPAMVRVAQ
jgi:molecular chaperone GrpE